MNKSFINFCLMVSVVVSCFSCDPAVTHRYESIDENCGWWDIKGFNSLSNDKIQFFNDEGEVLSYILKSDKHRTSDNQPNIIYVSCQPNPNEGLKDSVPFSVYFSQPIGEEIIEIEFLHPLGASKVTSCSMRRLD